MLKMKGIIEHYFCIDIGSLCCRTIPFKDIIQMKIQFDFSSAAFYSNCAMQEKMQS